MTKHSYSNSHQNDEIKNAITLLTNRGGRKKATELPQWFKMELYEGIAWEQPHLIYQLLKERRQSLTSINQTTKTNYNVFPNGASTQLGNALLKSFRHSKHKTETIEPITANDILYWAIDILESTPDSAAEQSNNKSSIHDLDTAFLETLKSKIPYNEKIVQINTKAPRETLIQDFISYLDANNIGVRGIHKGNDHSGNEITDLTNDVKASKFLPTIDLLIWAYRNNLYYSMSFLSMALDINKDDKELRSSIRSHTITLTSPDYLNKFHSLMQ